jgi:hypothetical protein
MTTDPTGTVGKVAESAPDLALALRGGPKFIARLQQLADARDEHDAALARLNLGREVEPAASEARALRADARNDRTAAATELANAKREAADILAVADRERASAQELRRNAEEQLRAATEADHAARQTAAKAEAAQRQAAAVEKKFNDKITRLKAELAQVM